MCPTWKIRTDGDSLVFWTTSGSSRDPSNKQRIWSLCCCQWMDGSTICGRSFLFVYLQTPPPTSYIANVDTQIFLSACTSMSCTLVSLQLPVYSTMYNVIFARQEEIHQPIHICVLRDAVPSGATTSLTVAKLHQEHNIWPLKRLNLLKVYLARLQTREVQPEIPFNILNIFSSAPTSAPKLPWSPGSISSSLIRNANLVPMSIARLASNSPASYAPTRSQLEYDQYLLPHMKEPPTTNSKNLRGKPAKGILCLVLERAIGNLASAQDD